MSRRRRFQNNFQLLDEEMSEGATPPVQRNAANARERARMRVLSSAFGRLKTKLPNIPADTKLSKLDTLRLATIYIRQLMAAVEERREGEQDQQSSNRRHPPMTDFSGNTSFESCRNVERMGWSSYGGSSSPLEYEGDFNYSTMEMGASSSSVMEMGASSSSALNPLDTPTSISQPLQRGEHWSAPENHIVNFNFNNPSNGTNFTHYPLRVPPDHHRDDEDINEQRIDLDGSWQSNIATSYSPQQQQQGNHSFPSQSYPSSSSYDCQHQYVVQYEQQQYSWSSLTSSPTSSSISSSSSSSLTLFDSLHHHEKDKSLTNPQSFSIPISK